MSGTPEIGRIAKIKHGTTLIGQAKDVSCEATVTIVKEYTLDSQGKPAVLKAGNMTFALTIGKLFVDKTYIDLVLTDEPLTFEIAPQGETAGKPKLTYTGVVLDQWGLQIKPDGITGENLHGEGTNLTTSTY